MKLVLVGLGHLADPLRERLPDIRVEAADPPLDAADAGRLLADASIAVMSRAAHDRFGALGARVDVPVICCIDAEAARESSEPPAANGVARVVFEPVDPDALAGDIRQLGGEPSAPGRTESDVHEAVAALWARFRDTMFERIEVLERVGAALLGGGADLDALEEARTAAHKLHGSLGTFGHGGGSQLAAELEAMLERGAPSEGDLYRYSELVVSLRRVLEQTDATPAVAGTPATAARPEPSAAETPTGATPRVLVLDADPSRADDMAAAAIARGWSPVIALSPDELERGTGPPAQLVIVDSDVADRRRLEAVLRRLALDRVPVVFVTDDADQGARLHASAFGVRTFAERSRGPAAAMERAATLLEHDSPRQATVLVVDDDPTTLALAASVLEHAGTRVVRLEDPLRFWQTLEAARPDLLLLDIEMPLVNGIQLCRVVRASARWADLPVIFLTGRVDRDTVIRAFRVGADDYITKPIHGPELRARVLNRLQRMRRQRRGGGTDLATGLLSRASAMDRAATAFALARRHAEAVAVAIVEIAVPPDHDARHPVARVAAALAADARPEDVVARWSETQFVLCLYGMSPDQAIDWLGPRVAPDESEPWEARSGAAGFPHDGQHLEELVEIATASMAVEVFQEAPPAAAQRVDVAVVEDDETLAVLLLQTLQARGLSARWIADGVEAASMLTGTPAGLEARVVLLDVGLPGLDGLTVLRRLAASGVTRRSRVVMLTARSAEAEVLRALELGAFDHVPKPFSLAELLHRVRRALESGASGS